MLWQDQGTATVHGLFVVATNKNRMIQGRIRIFEIESGVMLCCSDAVDLANEAQRDVMGCHTCTDCCE